MKICSVYDAEFARYGRVHSGIESAALLREMEKIPLPESGTAYEPSIAALEACETFADYRTSVFGGMPVQLGMCWGHNTKLNCLEYHRDSEFNLGLGDFILLLAKQDEIEDGVLDTAKVKAFRVPAGVLVEVYATTLHYAPCHTDETAGFRVLVEQRIVGPELRELRRRRRDAELRKAGCEYFFHGHGDPPERSLL